MVPITNKAKSDKQAQFIGEIGPNVTNDGVNQQVNDRVTTHSGGGAHFMASTIQTSSKDELAKTHRGR